jgi:hypothetical protein
MFDGLPLLVSIDVRRQFLKPLAYRPLSLRNELT